MPRVPTYDQFQATPNVAPNQPFTATPMPDVAGAQAQQLGKGMSEVGRAAGHIVAQVQSEANQLRVIDATAAAREHMYDLMYKPETGLLHQKGWNALHRESGKDLASEYSDSFEEQTAKIAESLGNDQQRALFSRQVATLRSQLHGTATQHMGSEYRTYQGGVMDAEIKSQSNAIGLIGSTDPGQINPDTGRLRIEESVEAIYTAARAKARQEGLPQTLADTSALEVVSGAHKMAIGGLLEAGRYEQASAYREKYKDQLTAHDLIDVAGKIDTEASLGAGIAIVDKTFGPVGAQMNPGDFDRAFNITVGSESGGKQFGADGKPLTSPKGAIGIAQVMPGTGPEAAKLAGLPWDESRYKTDKDYNLALGKAYFVQQIKDFGGDPAKVWAAYNAGPGATRAAISKAEKEGGNWLANLPSETQAYVTKNVAQLNAGGGAPKMPTEDEIREQVVAQLPPGTSPKVRKAVESEVGRRFALLKQGKEQRDGQAVDDAMTWLRANNYNWSAMPPSLRSHIPPDKLDNLMDYASKGAKGIPVQTDLTLYQQLSNDDYLRSLTSQQFAETRQNLSESDFKKFADRKDALSRPGAANGPGELNTPAVDRALKDRLGMMGIDTSPKHTDKDANARLGMIRKMVDDWLINDQKVAGRKFSDAETAKSIDTLFRQSVPLRDTFIGVTVSRSTVPLLSLKSAGDIPGDERVALKKDFERRGINPSDTDIVEAYIRGKLTQVSRQSSGRNATGAN